VSKRVTPLVADPNHPGYVQCPVVVLRRRGVPLSNEGQRATNEALCKLPRPDPADLGSRRGTSLPGS
jgi:hypothetical protein